MTAKYRQFMIQLNQVLNTVDQRELKATIGDSISNNRTVTVNQVVRFLEGSSSRKFNRLGASLLNVYTLFRTEILILRNNSRTDAVDINEFINFYRDAVINTNVLRSEVTSSNVLAI